MIKNAKTWVIICISVLVFFPPLCIGYIPELQLLDKMWTAARYLLCFLIFIKYFRDMYLRAECRNAFFMGSVAVVALMILSMCFNGTVYLTAATYCLTIIGMMLVNIVLYQYDAKRLFQVYKAIMFIYLLLHFFFLLIFKDGLNPAYTGDGRIYFLGNKNMVAPYMVIFLLSSLVLTIKYNCQKKVIVVVEFAALDIFAIVNASSTLLLVLGVIEIAVLIRFVLERTTNRMGKHVMWFFLAIASIIAICFFLMVVMTGSAINGLNAITSLVGKNATFSGRTDIWRAAVAYFKEHVVWGMGNRAAYDVWGNGVIVQSAHNTFLDCGVKYGIIVLLTYIMLWVICFVHMWKTRSNELSIMTIILLVATIVALMFEALEDNYVIWLILILSYLLTEKRYRVIW